LGRGERETHHWKMKKENETKAINNPIAKGEGLIVRKRVRSLKQWRCSFGHFTKMVWCEMRDALKGNETKRIDL